MIANAPQTGFRCILCALLDFEDGTASLSREVFLPFAPVPGINCSPGSENKIFPGLSIDLDDGSGREDAYEVYHVTWRHRESCFEVLVSDPGWTLARPDVESAAKHLENFGWSVDHLEIYDGD